MFCSLLPHGSAVRKVTPGNVWSAFSGLTPGRIFCMSTPLICATERVAVPVTTIVSSWPAGVVACSGSDAGVGTVEPGAASLATSDCA